MGGSTALLNSVKHTPTLKHVDDVVAAADKLSAMLAHQGDSSVVATKPPGLVETLAGGLARPAVSQRQQLQRGG